MFPIDFLTFLGFSAAEVIIVWLTLRSVNGRVPQKIFAQKAKETLSMKG